MYQINAACKYGANGIYKITDIRDESFSGEAKKYYILQSVSSANSVTYVPIDSEALVGRMSPVLTEDEVSALVEAIPEMEPDWIENDKERCEEFKRILESPDRRKICSMVKAIRHHRSSLVAWGKKLRTADEITMNRAEKLLLDEFSLVSKIGPDAFYGLFTG